MVGSSFKFIELTTMENTMNEVSARELGYAKDGKVYLKSILGQPDRIVGDVKAGEQEAVDYFIRRFEIIRHKVDSMVEAMDKAENKGSYLMQVLHLKEALKTFNAIGNFPNLLEKLETAEARINGLIEGNRVKNLEIKSELLKRAKEEIEHSDPLDVIKGIKEIRFNWMTVGSVSKEVEPELEAEFQEILDKYQVIKDKYTEERTIEIEIRKQKLMILLETASKLNTYPPEVEQSYYKFKKLEDEWKVVGNIPKVYYGPLFEQFKRIKKTIAKFARKGPGSRPQSGPKQIFIPRNYPPHEAPLYENLKRRVDLIEEAQGLLRMDLRQANEIAKEIQAKWKVAGQIPDSFKSEVFNQFNAISDRIFESSYLARVVNTKYPDYRAMSPADQVQAKIEAMDEIIIKEDMNVKVTQAEFEFMSPEDRATDENRSRFSRLNTSIRKLRMKIKIMGELKRDLDNIQNPGASSGYQNRGSYQSRPSSGYSQGGGYNNPGRNPSYNRENSGGYGNRDSGYNRGGNSGYGNSGSGSSGYNRDNGYGNRESGSSGYNRDNGYGNRESGSSGYNRDNGYGNRESGSSGYNRDNGYGNRESGSSGYNRDNGYGNRESGSSGYNRDNGYGNRDASQNRPAGGERRQYGERPQDNSANPRYSGNTNYSQNRTPSSDGSDSSDRNSSQEERSES